MNASKSWFDTVHGLPEPFQPIDAPQDKMLGLEIDTRYGKWLRSVEFACASCQESYTRRVVMHETYTEVIEIEGVGTYPVNPTMHFVYEAKPHRCEVQE